MASAYNQGTDVQVSAVFTDDGAPTDPTTISFNVWYPDGTLVTYVFGEDINVVRDDVGAYFCDLGIPPMPGQYRYNAVGAGVVEATLPGTFVVMQSVVDPSAPPPPGPVIGPCQTWITGEDVATGCKAAADLDQNLLDTAALEASQALYEISGRQFSGQCEFTARPTADPCRCWPSSLGLGNWTWLSYPIGVGGWGWGWFNECGDQLGCQPMSIVRLAGYPIRTIEEVKINGAVLPEVDDDGNLNYRLDGNRVLTRMDVPGSGPGFPAIPRRWPGCQNLSLTDDQLGTFSVRYKCGQDPPQLGRDAAVEIACQLAQAFNGNACSLPAGATTVTRQGVKVERGLLANWFDPTKPTGLVHLDLFLRAYFQVRASRRPAVWSPDRQGFAKRLG